MIKTEKYTNSFTNYSKRIQKRSLTDLNASRDQVEVVSPVFRALKKPCVLRLTNRTYKVDLTET